jgi:SNF2 family DNA or RNA helicase
VEEKVLALQRDKQALAETLILEKDLDLPRVSREDLLSLFD